MLITFWNKQHFGITTFWNLNYVSFDIFTLFIDRMQEVDMQGECSISHRHMRSLDGSAREMLALAKEVAHS